MRRERREVRGPSPAVGELDQVASLLVLEHEAGELRRVDLEGVEHLDERIITAAGVSAGIDMALRLAALLVDDVAARAMQLMVEYDPQPPFDCGALHKADAAVFERTKAYAALKD